MVEPRAGDALAGVVDASPEVGDLLDVRPQTLVVGLLADVEDVRHAVEDEVDDLSDCDLVVVGEVTADGEVRRDEVGVRCGEGREICGGV